jgi:hypothetical protein
MPRCGYTRDVSRAVILDTRPFSICQGHHIYVTTMAGSLKWFVYTTDDLTDFAIKLDESNTEAVNGANQDYVAGTGFRYSIPRNLKPRRAVYGSADGTRTISVVCLTQATYTGVPTAVTSISDPLTPANTLGLIRIVPERISPLPFAGDTGLIDGDAT